MARSAAAMVSGYARFDPDLRVVGVLFNKVGGAGHYHLLKEAVEVTTDLAVVGYLPADPSFTIEDRHLGLITALEQPTGALSHRLARAIDETVDVDRVESLARAAPPLEAECARTEPQPSGSAVRVGVTTLDAPEQERVLFIEPERRDEVDSLRDRVAEFLMEQGSRREVVLAALAE